MPITKKCEICKKEFTRSPALAGKCCSRKCGYEHRKQKRMKKEHQQNRKSRQMIYEPSHPLAGKNGYLPIYRFLLYNKIGPGWHPCNWCGKKIRWIINIRRTGGFTLIVDHVDNNPKNNHISNLVPSCQSCNTKRGMGERIVKNNECFIERSNGTRLRATLKTCRTCKREFKISISALATGCRRNRTTGKYCSPKCLHKRDRSKDNR